MRCFSSPRGQFHSHRSPISHVRHSGSHEDRQRAFAPCQHGVKRAACSLNARGEKWRARPGCGGERGEGHAALAGAHSELRAPTTVAKKDALRALLSSPPISHAGTPQSDETEFFLTCLRPFGNLLQKNFQMLLMVFCHSCKLRVFEDVFLSSTFIFSDSSIFFTLWIAHRSFEVW